MKKFILLLSAMFMLGSSPILAQQSTNVEQTTKQAEKEAKKAQKEAEKAAKKAEKEAKKAKEEAISNALFDVAVKALEERKFVLKATEVEFKRGHTSHVNSANNFVMLDGEEASIQFSSNTAILGPNGMGGLTVDGKASHIEMKTDKKGNITFSMSVQGTAVSAKVEFRMSKGNNRCSATILPNFNSNRTTFSGELVPLTNANNVFKGRSF